MATSKISKWKVSETGSALEVYTLTVYLPKKLISIRLIDKEFENIMIGP